MNIIKLKEVIEKAYAHSKKANHNNTCDETRPWIEQSQEAIYEAIRIMEKDESALTEVKPEDNGRIKVLETEVAYIKARERATSVAIIRVALDGLE